MLGLLGTGAELLLLQHYEDAAQYTPLVVIGCALISLCWVLIKPARHAVRAMRLVMAALAITGAIGIGLHMDGNEEFELEMYPDRQGWELLWKTLAGATPALAPGAMTLLGLIGLAQTHDHPALRRAPKAGFKE